MAKICCRRLFLNRSNRVKKCSILKIEAIALPFNVAGFIHNLKVIKRRFRNWQESVKIAGKIQQRTKDLCFRWKLHLNLAPKERSGKKTNWRQTNSTNLFRQMAEPSMASPHLRKPNQAPPLLYPLRRLNHIVTRSLFVSFSRSYVRWRKTWSCLAGCVLVSCWW